MKPETSILDVFVYGTLKPGEVNYPAYCEGKVTSQIPAYTWGDLYALSVGYPAMVEGNNKVQGVLLQLNNINTLKSLDQLEGYQEDRRSHLNEYNRQLVTVYRLDDRAIAQAWVYFMTLAKVRQYQGEKVTSGNWTGLSAWS